MKTTSRLLLLTLLLAPTCTLAQSRETPAYPEWDQLSEAQKATLVAPLRDRWNDNPGERARMLERAKRWQDLTPQQRDRVRHGMDRWEKMGPEQRQEARALFHAMHGMDKAQREAFLADWRKKTPQQRAEWLKAHPAPEHGKQGHAPKRD